MNDDEDIRIHRSIEHVFTVLTAKHLIPRRELRERVEAFCAADREEEQEREARLDAEDFVDLAMKRGLT